MKIWFKAKTYGYGWYPASWQGWTVMAIYGILFACLITAFQFNLNRPYASLWYISGVGIITVALVAISAWKGEKARWRWGDDDDPKAKGGK